MAARTPRGTLKTHVGAVERMLRVTGLGNVPEEAPLVMLIKDLAREMDAGGGTRARADYLSALKDVRRVLNGATAPARVKPPTAAERKASAAIEEAAEVLPATPDDLQRFRQEHGIA